MVSHPHLGFPSSPQGIFLILSWTRFCKDWGRRRGKRVGVLGRGGDAWAVFLVLVTLDKGASKKKKKRTLAGGKAAQDGRRISSTSMKNESMSTIIVYVSFDRQMSSMYTDYMQSVVECLVEMKTVDCFVGLDVDFLFVCLGVSIVSPLLRLCTLQPIS